MDYYVSGQEEDIAPLNVGGKQRKVGFEETAIRDILTKQIYTDPKAGFRELYANAVRACLTAKEEYGANPRIEIMINPKTLDFEIMEYDSTGITHKIFDEVLTVLGRSSNFDGTKPGQFGIGIAAYHAISDNMFVESRARNGDEISSLIRGMQTCDDVIKSNPVSFKNFGTKVKLKMQKLSEAKYIDAYATNWHLLKDVIAYLKDMAMFSGIETWLNIERVGGDWPGSTGRNQIGPVDPRTKMNIDPDKYDTMFVINNDDYDLIAHGKKGGTYDRMFQKVTLAGMPMSKPELTLWDFRDWYINVKNERDYEPVASRDGFTEKTISALNEKIKKDMEKWLLDYMHVDTIEKWIELPLYRKKQIKALHTMIGRNDIKDMRLEKLGELDSFMWSNLRTFRYGSNKEELAIFKDTVSMRGNKEIVCMKRADAIKLKAMKDYIVVVPESHLFDIVAKYVRDATNISSKAVRMYSSNHTDRKDIEVVFEHDILDTDIRVKTPREYSKRLHRAGVRNVRFFQQKKSDRGILLGDFINNLLDKKYDDVKGFDIVSKNYLIVNAHSKMFKKMKKNILALPFVRLSESELKDLKMACILRGANIYKLPEFMSTRSVCSDISKKYGDGVSFNDCAELPSMMKSLDNIKDDVLRNSIAIFYSTLSKYPNMEIKEIIKTVDGQIGDGNAFDNLTDLAVLLSIQPWFNDTRLAWRRIFGNMDKTKSTARTLTKLLGGRNGKWNERTLVFNVNESTTIGGSNMDLLQNIGLINSILKVEMLSKSDSTMAKIYISA